MNLGEAAALMGAHATSISAEMFDKQIRDYSIDSRSVGAGELFFALSQQDYARAGFNGEFVDAHRFIGDAFERGAIAAVARADRVNGDADLESVKDRLLWLTMRSLLCNCSRIACTRPGKTGRRDHRQRRKDDGERVDGARSSIRGSSRVEE